jgi:hypothetical protein
MANKTQEMVQVRVRLTLINNKFSFLYGYWDIVSDVFVDIFEYLQEGERKELEKLSIESIREFGYLDTAVELKVNDFVDIQDSLIIKFAEKCKSLEG